MPLQATSGAASYDAFGGGVAAVPTYIEDVFSTYLYTGTGASQTITNGIDLSTKGGLVWLKGRSAISAHWLGDSARGASNILETANTGAQYTDASVISSFSSTGFSVGSANAGGTTYASWTFRKQPKFFDVVTYTGDGATFKTISHSLGSVPGCIIVKKANNTSNWWVRHRSQTNIGRLNLTNTFDQNSDIITNLTSTTFDVGVPAGGANTNGDTYVAYLFAHNAGGFGLTGTDNVISCGSYTGNGSTNGPEINLGYEPQWLLVKEASGSSAAFVGWYMFDNMRGFTASGSNDAVLRANESAAEDPGADYFAVQSTGFKCVTTNALANESGGTYIYIAIRRGPMKVPTSGTSVLGLSARTGTGATATVTGGAGVTDLAIIKNRNVATAWVWTPRLTGTGYLSSNATTAETAAGATILQTNPWDVMDGVKVGTTSNLTNASANTFVNYLIDRAPGFMDVVCYTGTGGTGSRSLSHNLQTVPELIILKSRSGVANWQTGSMFTSTTVTRAVLSANNDQDLNSLYSGQSIWGGQPTASTFLIDATGAFNTSAATYVAYLFATCAGVSKVGSYTGTGTTLQVNCGFTGGARFVMIKRTDSTGDWYVWDTARGIVAGNDPYLLFNTTASEQNTDYIDTYSAGFEISSTAPAAINASGGTFIFLAIA